MRVVKVTAKGQVTIPIEVREQLGITDDSYLEVSVAGNAITMRTRTPARSLGDDDPIWELVGIGSSGGSDGSIDHDRHLADGEMKRWRKS